MYSSPVLGSVFSSSSNNPLSEYVIKWSSHIRATSSINVFSSVNCSTNGCCCACCTANIALPLACSGLIVPVAISPAPASSLDKLTISFCTFSTSELIWAGFTTPINLLTSSTVCPFLVLIVTPTLSISLGLIILSVLIIFVGYAVCLTVISLLIIVLFTSIWFGISLLTSPSPLALPCFSSHTIWATGYSSNPLSVSSLISTHLVAVAKCTVPFSLYILVITVTISSFSYLACSPASSNVSLSPLMFNSCSSLTPFWRAISWTRITGNLLLINMYGCACMSESFSLP